jgi:two-component system, cell cycle response regulator CpdR
MAQALTVLVVEDDDLIRDNLAEALPSAGFHVLTADNGYAAMRILAQEHVDVLLTDIVMPGLNGIELAKEAKVLRPGLKIMLATGYFSRAEEARPLGTLLFKPLRIHEIEAEIRRLAGPPL